MHCPAPAPESHWLHPTHEKLARAAAALTSRAYQDAPGLDVAPHLRLELASFGLDYAPISWLVSTTEAIRAGRL